MNPSRKKYLLWSSQTETFLVLPKSSFSISYLGASKEKNLFRVSGSGTQTTLHLHGKGTLGKDHFLKNADLLSSSSDLSLLPKSKSMLSIMKLSVSHLFQTIPFMGKESFFTEGTGGSLASVTEAKKT
jgi:hypothetical protein